ncbi:MAG: PSD1 and planctomycete cytochrome C domain-containing protein [Planctomycetota bacterium]
MPFPFVFRFSATMVFAMGCLWIGTALGQDEAAQPTPEQIQFFEAKIRPVLIEHCYRCHSVDGQSVRGGLVVDNRDAMLAGGESGPAVVPGNLQESILWHAINYRDYRMPPSGRLPANVIEDFKTWIEMGAPDPRVQVGVVVHSRVSPEDIEQAKSFWSFKKPEHRSPDPDPRASWARSEIDRYIASGWKDQGVEPTADCDPETLVRRISFDVIGLPPTPKQRQAFVARSKSDLDGAISDLVEELLSSPQFGEKWGRHWLDVARYAESTGKERDVTFPHAWRYRDYVIRSFNEDKPYDRFVMEQVAGDLMPAANDNVWNEHLIATGFLAMGPKSLAEQSPRQFQADLVDEQIDTVSRTVLGLSVGCARCHDHKFDPIPQADYYALAGIFQSTETYFGGSRSQRNRQPSDLIILPVQDREPIQPPLSSEQLKRLKEELAEKEKELVEARRAQRTGGGGNNSLLNAALLDQIVSQLSSRIASVDKNGRPISFCMGVQDGDAPRNARILVRGEIDSPAQEVPRGFLQILDHSSSKLPAKGSGRLALAKWLTSRDNPLTARVMVNRIWQNLIGQGIVREPDNFGMSGPQPTHPELLDHLAIEFMDHQWSVKHMVRSIVQSRVYRLSSRCDQERLEADPENKLIARGNVRRLNAEAIRDAMLAVSGQLDTKPPKASPIAYFGSVDVGPNGPMAVPLVAVNLLNPAARENMSPEQRAERMREAMRNGMRNPNINIFETPNYHRSVYLPIARNQVPRSLDAFDFAEPSLVIGTREVSHTAEQALYMLNNPFVLELSDALARRLIQQTKDPRERVATAFRLAYGREATSSELETANQFFRKAASSNKNSNAKRDEAAFQLLSQFCQALFGAAEFRILN